MDIDSKQLIKLYDELLEDKACWYKTKQEQAEALSEMMFGQKVWYEDGEIITETISLNDALKQ